MDFSVIKYGWMMIIIFMYELYGVIHGKNVWSHGKLS